MSVRIDPSQLSAAIMAELSKYQGATDEVLDHAAKTAAQHAVSELKFKSPRLSGKYANSWKVKQGNRSKVGGTKTVIIYNKHYRLTHLLEHGHIKVVYGYWIEGIVPAKPHIWYVEQETIQEFEELVKMGVEQI